MQMIRRFAPLAGAAFAATAALMPLAGIAQTTPPGEVRALTNVAISEEQARLELRYLTPAVRAEVERRATQGNSIRGVMETMLLNNVSQLFAASKVLAV